MTVAAAPDDFTDRGNAAAGFAWLLIFPAFIAYQVLVQAGSIAPSLGGYGTAGAVAALPFALHAFQRQASVHGFAPTPVGLLFALYLLLFSIVVFVSRGGFADPAISQPHIAYIFKFGVWYLVARSVDGDSPRFRTLAGLVLLGISALVIWLALTRGTFAAVLLPADPEGFQGDYQAAAMVFCAMAAYVLPSLRLSLRIPVYVISVATLFLVGARSEFAAFFLLVIVIEWCKARSRVLMTLLMLAAAIVFLLLVRGFEATADGNRIFGLLAIASDESAIMRAELLDQAWITVWENPVLGAYASYPPGAYAHNLVSAWVDFGIVGFFLLLCLIAFPLAGLLMRFAEDSRRDDFIRTLAVAAIVALLLGAAKVHTYQLLAVSLGMYARYRTTRRSRLLAAA